MFFQSSSAKIMSFFLVLSPDVNFFVNFCRKIYNFAVDNRAFFLYNDI